MSLNQRSVLIVDDCVSTRRYLHVLLEKAGYRVRTSSDASAACWEIASEPPDYVITDWQMPDMDGAELCKWVRSREFGKYIYFTLMTAHDRFFDVVDGLDAGADDYLLKPVKGAELLARIRSGDRILSHIRQLEQQAEGKAIGVES